MCSVLENLNGSVIFALNYSLYDRISDGNRVQKISAYYDYATVICQVVIRLEKVIQFQSQTNFLLVRNNVFLERRDMCTFTMGTLKRGIFVTNFVQLNFRQGCGLNLSFPE